MKEQPEAEPSASSGGKDRAAQASGQWRDMEELFLQVLEQPFDDRAAFLDASCRDPELRRLIDSMLSADAEAADFLEEPWVSWAPVDVQTRGQEERIGKYRLDSEIGRGGMGRVYLARPVEDDLQRPVALKVTRQDLAGEEFARRLRGERRILASLNHPAIARLYDGGTTAENRPFFVMEYVEGEPIDAFCERQRSSVRERLVLFREICAAVRYAHQNLVVHRDLKPSNILVTAQGEPKLLDFGIAKILDPEASPAGADLTASSLRPMTPGYASPEQFSGQRVTTASDIYSLGVLLYKLLSGSSPFDFTGRTVHEIERMVLEEEPVKPSLRVGRAMVPEPTGVGSRDAGDAGDRAGKAHGAKLRRQLRGDLDSIVLKALRKSPQQRYGSVDELSEDLRRYLEGLPVLAHRGSWRYRAGKLMRRHRVALAIAALITLLVVGFTSLTLVQATRLAHERDQNKQVVALMRSIFIAADPYEKGDDGSDLTVRAALEISEEGIRRQLVDQPETRATLLNILGRIHLSLGSPKALSLLQDALQIRRELFGERHPAVAQTASNLAHALYEKSVLAALQQSREAVAMLRQSGSSDPALLLEVLNNLVTLLCWEGAVEEAEPLSSEALALAETLPGDPAIGLFYALANRAIVLSRRGEWAAAHSLRRRALSEQEEALGPQHPWVGETLNGLSHDLLQLKEYDRALAYNRRATAIRLKHLGESDPVLANSHSLRGDILHQLGRLEGARTAYREAAEILARTAPQNLYRLLIGIKTARIQMQLGELTAAELLLRESLAEWRRRRPGGHWVIAQAQSVLGECLVSLERFDEAERMLTRSLEFFQQLGRVEAIEETLARLVGLYEASGRPAEAADYRSRLAALGKARS